MAEEIKSRPFFVRNYRNEPVLTKEQDASIHRPYRSIPHDPETDAEMGNPGRKLLQEASDDGTVYEMVLRPTGERTDLARVPWVLVEPHVYGPNPTGEPL